MSWLIVALLAIYAVGSYWLLIWRPERKRRAEPIGTVRVYTVEFLEDDVWEGSLPQYAYENAHVDDFECDDLDEAVRVFEREGLRFDATGTDWAADPDGSRIADYATGLRHEVTAHLHGFTETDVRKIVERVG